MSRFVVQSAETFQFLHFSPVRQEVCWTPSLLAALRFGVVADYEAAQQLIEDHCDRTAVAVDVDSVQPEV